MHVVIKKNSKSLAFALTTIFYRLFLDLSYLYSIVPVWSYAGFYDFHTFGLGVMSWVLTLLSLPFIVSLAKNNVTKISDLIIMFLYYFSYIPFNTLVFSGILNKRFIIMNTIYALNIAIFHRVINGKKVKGIILDKNNILASDLLLKLIALLSLLATMFVSMKYTDFRLNFDLTKVYELRTEAANFNMPTILEYLYTASSFINILFLTYFAMKKKYIISFVFFLAQMFSFGVGGHKSIFLITILAVLLLIFLKGKLYDNFKNYFPLIIIFSPLISLLETKITDNITFSSIFLRRAVLLPVQLGSYYVDFFSKNKPDFFKASILRHFGFKTMYPNIKKDIGIIYQHSYTSSANNGLISDAVMNFGTIGIIIMPFILILLLYLLDKVSDGLDKRIIIIVAFYFSMNIINSFLNTVLLTGGMIAITFCLLLLRTNNLKSNSINDIAKK